MAKPPTQIFYEGSMYPGDPDDIEDRIHDREVTWVQAARDWLAANPGAKFKTLKSIPNTLPADVQWGLEKMVLRGRHTTQEDRKRVRGG